MNPGLPHIEGSTTTQCAIFFRITQCVLLDISFVVYYGFSEGIQSSDAILGKSILISDLLLLLLEIHPPWALGQVLRQT
jgi:hypothetical protein